MKASVFRSARLVAAMLSVALTMVFTMASATSVVDTVQHQGVSAGPHQHLPFSVIHFDDPDAGDETQPAGEGVAPDKNPGPGHHHHSDGPSGLTALGASIAATTGIEAASQATMSRDISDKAAPNGLERPPRPLSSRV